MQIGQGQAITVPILVVGEEPVAADLHAVLDGLGADDKHQPDLLGRLPHHRHLQIGQRGEHGHQHTVDDPEPGFEWQLFDGHRPDGVVEADIGMDLSPAGDSHDIPLPSRDIRRQFVEHLAFGFEIALADGALGERAVVAQDDFDFVHR